MTIRVTGSIEDHGTVKLWRCPGCGFGFDAVHTIVDEQGEYHECPMCHTMEFEDGIVVREPQNGE